MTGTESLTDEEIAAGHWLSEETFGLSGLRWVMLSASTYSCPEGADCVDGFSNVVQVKVPARTLDRSSARSRIHDTMSNGRFAQSFEGASYSAYDPDPIRRCTRLSRLRVRCNLAWAGGDIGYSGSATVIRRIGVEDDQVRWSVRVTNYYCRAIGGKRCVRTYRS